MAKKLLKKVSEKKSKEIRIEEPKANSVLNTEELDIISDAPVLGSELQIEPVIEQPKSEPLPKGVLRIEEVVINGRNYKKYWRDNGTSDLELVG